MERLKQKATSSFRYAIGMFGTSIPINMFKTYAAIFYVDTLGLDMKKYSLVLLIYTFVDAIDNPVYGFLSDRTRTKWGRRRPWLVIGTPLLVLCFILFYNIPSGITSQKTLLFVYMLLMYILTGTIDSLINANYGALFPELFPNDNKRASTNAMRQAFQLVAMVISIALTPMITAAIGYSLTSVIYGLLAGAVILYCTFGCHEHPEYMQSQPPKIRSSLWALFTNKKFWIYGFTNAFYSSAMSLVMQAIPFYIKYALGLDSSMSTLLMGSVLGIALVGVLIWSRIVKKFTLMPSWRAALCVMGLGFLPLYFVSSLPVAIAVSSVIGFGAAGVMATMDVVAARIMDEDFKKHGVRREGVYSSAMGFMNRLNGLFTSFAFFLASTIFGFESGDAPGDNPAGAAKFLLAIFPFAAMAMSVLFSMLMRFDKKTEELQETEDDAE